MQLLKFPKKTRHLAEGNCMALHWFNFAEYYKIIKILLSTNFFFIKTIFNFWSQFEILNFLHNILWYRKTSLPLTITGYSVLLLVNTVFSYRIMLNVMHQKCCWMEIQFQNVIQLFKNFYLNVVVYLNVPNDIYSKIHVHDLG